MTDYVLVHGGAHAAWCWAPMIPYLNEDPRVGRTVALDLVGHGSRLDEKPHDEVSLEDYIQDIAGAITNNDLRDVVLVGHSLAGVSVPQAAARVSDRVKRVVFVSALIPAEGKTAEETFRRISEGQELAVGGYDLSFRHMFCNDADEATAEWLLGKLGPEPMAGMTTPVDRSDFPRSMPTSYVLLTRDQALPLDSQRELLRNIGDPDVVELDSGHDAMVTHPRELAEALLRYA